MGLRDPGRSGKTFGVDDAVARVLASWSSEADSDLGRLNLKRAALRLSAEQRGQLVDRLAEISLGMLFVLLEKERGP